MKDFRRNSGQSAGRNGGFEKRDYSGGRERTNEFGDSRPKYDTRPGQNKFQNNRSDRPDVKHKAICSECHNQCEVPFKPNGSKPVYCADCFGKKKGAMPMPQAADRNSAPRPEQAGQSMHARDPRIDELKAHMSAISSKLDRIISAMEKSVSAPAQAKVEKQIQNHAVVQPAVTAVPVKMSAKPESKKIEKKVEKKAAPQAPKKVEKKVEKKPEVKKVEKKVEKKAAAPAKKPAAKVAPKKKK